MHPFVPANTSAPANEKPAVSYLPLFVRAWRTLFKAVCVEITKWQEERGVVYICKLSVMGEITHTSVKLEKIFSKSFNVGC